MSVACGEGWGESGPSASLFSPHQRERASASEDCLRDQAAWSRARIWYNQRTIASESIRVGCSLRVQ